MTSYPELVAAAARMEALQDDYLAEYEFDDGENFSHSPTEFEQLLLNHAISGLLSDEAFLDALTDWRLLVRAMKADTAPAGRAR